MKESYNIISPLLIYIVVLIVGVVFYLMLRKRIISKGVVNPPIGEMFIIFFTYGGLLTLILTVFFGEWSGLASLGAFYLIILAPIVMLIVAYRQYKKRKTSIYHQWMFYLGLFYFIISPLIFLILYHFSKS